MAKAALIGLLTKMAKKPPRFGSEGEPEEATERGGDPGSDNDAPDDYQGGESAPSEDLPGEPSDYEHDFQQAVDDLADVAGISPEDRQDFGAALKTAIHACLADAMRDGGEDEHGADGGEENDEEGD